jgi:lipopolysaccharide cholinephosphotransferase
MEDLSHYNPEGSTLRIAQLRMLEILKVVDAICTKHEIEYTLCCGSLLGAVRHGGFIPWDDDIDINVTRDDLAKLRKILPRELPSHLVYQDYFTDPYYPTPIAKVRERDSYMYEGPCTDKLKEKGIFIDIIPIEEVPNLAWKAKLDYWYGHCLRGIHHYVDTKDTILSWIVLPFAWGLTALTRLTNKFRRIDQLAHVYGFQAYGALQKKDYYPIKRISFEGFQACVPNNPDAVLTALFGDYMQLPPEDKRRVHSSKIEFYSER